MHNPQLSKSGVRYRNAMGIPLDAPRKGRNGRGGNYQITEAQARKIWADIQHLTATYPKKTVDITAMVARHNKVSKSLVQNIRYGRSWNSVTGLEFKKYD